MHLKMVKEILGLILVGVTFAGQQTSTTKLYLKSKNTKKNTGIHFEETTNHA